MKLRSFISHPWLHLGLLLFICTLPTLPYYYFGENLMWQNHDSVIHVIRLFHVREALLDGVFLPNWISSFTFGHGSSVFLLNWFLPYYLAATFNFIGLSLVDSIKAVFLASFLFSGFAMYLLAKPKLGHWAGLAATSLFLLAPYRLTVIFTRGAFGEAVGIALLPLLFHWVINTQTKKKTWMTSILVAITLSLIVISHNVIALFAGGLMVVWWIINYQDFKSQLPSIKGFMLAALLTVFFWLPALAEKNYTHIDRAQAWYLEQFVSPMALINSAWQYGPAQPQNQVYSMSFQLGKIHLLLVVILSLLLTISYLLYKQKNLLKKYQTSKLSKVIRYSKFSYQDWNLIIFAGTILGGSIFVQLAISQVFWNNFGLLQMVIFPWRFQAVTILALALWGGYVFRFLQYKMLATIALVLLLLLANRHHFPAAPGDYAKEDFIASYGHDGSSMGEFLPKTASLEEYWSWFEKESKPPTDLVVASDDYQVVSLQTQGNRFDLEIEAKDRTTLVLNHYYFPGWVAEINGRKSIPNHALASNNGRISLNLSPGTNKVMFSFTQTPIRKISQFISLGTLVALVLLFLYEREILFTKKENR